MTSETTAVQNAGTRRLPGGARLIKRHGVLVVFALAILIFSILRPDAFLTVGNFKSIVTSQSILVVAALGITIPLVSGQFDLSIAGNISFTGLIVAGLMSGNGLPWGVAVVTGMLLGMAIGLTNGLLVAYGGVHSFIATLGMGTILTGLSLWYSGGQTIFENIPDDFVFLMRGALWGIPLPVFYLVIAVVLVWFLFTQTSFGRHWYAIGGNAPAAEVAGVTVKRHIVLALSTGGALGGVAAIMLVSRAGSALPGGGDTYLLASFAAAFIGAAASRRGNFNAIGTLLGVYFLATLVNGAFSLGAANYVTSLISGIALILAVLGNRLTVGKS